MAFYTFILKNQYNKSNFDQGLSCQNQFSTLLVKIKFFCRLTEKLFIKAKTEFFCLLIKKAATFNYMQQDYLFENELF